MISLAFALMDTHVHFVLYGEFRECNSFMHEYVRRTSSYISIKYRERHKLKNLAIQHTSDRGDIGHLRNGKKALGELEKNCHPMRLRST